MNCKTNKEYIEICNNVQHELKKYLEREDKYKKQVITPLHN